MALSIYLVFEHLAPALRQEEMVENLTPTRFCISKMPTLTNPASQATLGCC